MAYKGLFIIQIDSSLKTSSNDLDVICLPFNNCPDGMLTHETIITVGFKDKSLEELEITVQGKPVYYGGWEIHTYITNSDALQAVYDYLMLPENGRAEDRRLIALESFEFV